MRRKGILLLILVLAVAGVAAQDMMGKLADQLYAPEQITIRVLSTDYTACPIGERCDIEVRAEVVAVQKTETDLEVGDKIVIKYERLNPPDGWDGPEPITLVERGQEYKAFLATYRYSFYVPIAGNASFADYTQTLYLELADIQRDVSRLQEKLAGVQKVLNE